LKRLKDTAEKKISRLKNKSEENTGNKVQTHKVMRNRREKVLEDGN